jgi:2-polyprenyl-3-methyl-5-hydroxy-6-metoxy-1,4-benzoquinol methylase
MTIYKECKICKGEVKKVNEKHNLVKCANCKLIFCETVFSQSEFIELYNELYNKENAKYSSYSIVEYNMVLENKKIKIGFYRSKLIKKHILKGKCNSVLEIGSGIGLIGSYIRKENKSIHYAGIEIDKESYEKSQILKLNTFNGDFTAIARLEEKFDIIMLWEVLEHLQDLSLFMKLAYERLNNNGKIILSVPNYNKIYNYKNREKDRLHQDGPPIHLNFFTKENIKTLFDMYQFKDCIVSVKKLPCWTPRSLSFYKSLFKAVFNRFHGSTIFLIASKKE